MWTEDIRAALIAYYETVKGQILTDPPYIAGTTWYSPSLNPDSYPNENRGYANVERAKWHYAIKKMGLDPTLRLQWKAGVSGPKPK
jgi:hypothetical protein